MVSRGIWMILPLWAAEFRELGRRIWQNFPWKTGPYSWVHYRYHTSCVIQVDVCFTSLTSLAIFLFACFFVRGVTQKVVDEFCQCKFILASKENS